MQRRNVPNHTQQGPPKPADETSLSADAGILSFDQSSGALDERRRTIVADVEEIDKSCTKVNEFTQLEKNLNEQAGKDLAHANNENASLFRGASETLDSLNMSDHVRLGLEQTLKQQLATNLNPQDPDGITFGDAGQNGGIEQQGAEKENSLFSIRKQHRAKLDQVDEISASWKEGSEALGGLMGEKKAAEDAFDATLARAESDRSSDRLIQEKDSTKVHQKTLEQVLEGTSTVKVTLEQAKGRNKQIVTEGRAMMQALESKKKSHSDKEAELSKVLGTAEEKQHHEAKLLAALEAELASLSVQEEALNKQLEEIETLSCARVEKKRELEDARTERTALFAKNTELGSKFTVAKAKCDSSTRAILDQKEIQSDIEADKAANDKIEFEKLVQGRSEFAELSQVKEKLSSLIADVKNKDAGASKTLEADKENLAALQEEDALLSKELEEKSSVLDEHERALAEHKHGFNKDFETEMARVNEFKKKTVFEMERSSDVQKHLEFERKAQVLKLGVALLKQTRNKEKEYALGDGDF